MADFPTPTREAALERLREFVPTAARYASRRNVDHGPGRHEDVSRLSPYIRTRLITEEEVTRAVLAAHSPRAAEKFLQEVAWRTYWKGWLEMRPAVWRTYSKELMGVERSGGYEKAVAGETGIDCFDHWARELVESGYLHNHARMWFASIWVFTLKLPWQLGADFFMQRLLDADAAANTLSWRWVAGLHTQGKHYLARASNIARFTHGRMNPQGELNESAEPLQEEHDFEKQALELPMEMAPQGRVGHLMLAEDLAPPPASHGKLAAVAAYLAPELETSPMISGFLKGALQDALQRAEGSQLQGDFEQAVSRWAAAERLDALLISRPCVGPGRDFIERQTLPLPVFEFVRDWDRRLWPLATGGFFKLKKALPQIHAELRD